RLRAIETGRWVVQVAPTGFSAVIGPDGTVHQRSAVSERAVLQATVGVREGTTPYADLGLLPAWVVALASLGGGWALARRTRRPAVAAPADGDRSDDAGDERGTTAIGPGAGEDGPDGAEGAEGADSVTAPEGAGRADDPRAGAEGAEGATAPDGAEGANGPRAGADGVPGPDDRDDADGVPAAAGAGPPGAEGADDGGATGAEG
ncbi:MAG TPA: hypothetical protein VF743_03205, partial [Acidimicrobiales bacterium]